ncbi:transmembrane protease serine 9-like isoform X2 [Stegodyphus dumicola]|nr:transmembrane protease serine 9-like isoform X2 [Stegodyphus dumicola]XP_035206248.1 transmembrane protease serine 9-like isoform X2 [Stegodyphus dumicola]XP_035206257.1 transmembrane protease serine 9-like isoform X2 [Stegodyphus dumicola]
MFKPARENSKKLTHFEDLGISKWNKHLNKIMSTNDTEKSNEISDDLDAKIVNGREAEEGEFPWMVALHYNGRFICSSFLISPTIVMTAAHCVQFEDSVEPATAFYGIIGNIRRSGPETRIDFSEVAAHPEYGTGSEYDIAVFRTTQPVEMSETISTICLPTAGRKFEFEPVRAMGWGVTSTESREPPEILMTTEMTVEPTSLCQAFFAISMITITDRHVCVTSFRATGVCFGDSGGPLVYEDPESGRPLAIGVASFVTILGCGRPLVPSVYTATSGYIDWLNETVVDTSDICFV